MDTLQGIEFVEAGRSLGHDLFHRSQLPRSADWPLPIQEGYDLAASRKLRRGPADRFQRKWLQLRLQAWQRGRVVASDVTVDLLRDLDVTHCPVTRERLTHGERCGTDWSIDRLNNDGAYAASNLAVLGTRANRAKGSRSFEEVLALARQPAGAQGLEPHEWQRLAALMVGPAYAARHDEAPMLPLCAALPARSARLALQQIQRLLTVHCARPAGKNALVRDLRKACRSQRSQHALRGLADAVHEGLKQLHDRQECWDVWLQPTPMQALARWRQSLDADEWAGAARISGQLSGGRPVTARSLQTWCLPTHGYFPGHLPGHRPTRVTPLWPVVRALRTADHPRPSAAG